MRILPALTLGVPLDRDHVVAVGGIGQRLGVPPGRTLTYPHISLLVLLECPDPAAVNAALAAVAARTRPFSVRARGFGVFNDGRLVLHVPVVRTAEFARLHRDLHDTVTATGAQVDGHHTPASWFPHVTLWDRTLTPAKLGEAVLELAAGPPIAWTLPVTRLARLEATGMTATIPLGAVTSLP